MSAPEDPIERRSFEVPSSWSEDAAEALAELCFGVACVPTRLVAVTEDDVPRFLWRHCADEAAAGRLIPETSARQVFDRIAGDWTYRGWRGGYFDTAEDAEAFYDEARFLLCHQMAAPEAAQWARTGLHWAYGTGGASEGWILADRTGERRPAAAHDIPPHGVAIVDASSGNGPVAPWRDEALAVAQRLETAIDVSRIAAPGRLGHALRVGESAAQAARPDAAPGRAVVLDAGHPDRASFVAWRAGEARRAATLATGATIALRHIEALASACRGRGRKAFDPARNPALRLALIAAREAGLPDEPIEHALRLTRQGRAVPELAGIESDLEEAEAAPATRHLVRVAPAHLEDDAIIDDVALASWMSPGNGVLFAASAEGWNPCAADGRIGAAASDGGYIFLAGTAATRGSINLLAFRGTDGKFDGAHFAHAVRLLTLALDLTIGATAQPSAALADGAWLYRPIGIGLANLGPLLLASGLGYDAAPGRALAAAIAALAGGAASATSAEMAEELGAFPQFAANRDHMLRVMRNHRRAASGEREGYEGLQAAPAPFNAEDCPDAALADAARTAWDEAVARGAEHGFRNAQTTMIAPLRASERVMGCDAFGIDPESALVKYERLPGGGYRKAVNRHVAPALAALGYAPGQIADILAHVAGHGTLAGAPGIDHAALRARGFTAAAIQALESALGSVTELSLAFNRWTLGAEFCTRGLGFSAHELDDYGFDMLKALGFVSAAVEAANAWCCGARTLEGAPHLDPAHLAVFDCPRPQGPTGRRALAPAAGLRMMAAIQPFVSGGVGRGFALGAEATVEDFAAAIREAARLGLKVLMLQREASAIALADSPAHRTFEDRDRDDDSATTQDHGSVGAAHVPAKAPPMTVALPASLRDRLVVIEGGERPASVSAPQPGTHASAAAIVPMSGGGAGSRALMPALTTRGAAVAVEEERIETSRTESAMRCPSCGGFAPRRTDAGVKCGICGAVHG